jgi:hypothetical protein
MQVGTISTIKGKKSFRAIDGSLVDFYPDAPKIERISSGFIDPETSLCLDANFIPTKSSQRDYIEFHDEMGYINLITRCERVVDLGLSKKSIQAEQEIRERGLQEYINTLKYKNIKSLPNDKVYIKLSDQKSMFNPYNFGHLIEMLTKIRNLEKYDLGNKKVCYLLCKTGRIFNIESWFNALSPFKNYETFIFKSNALYHVNDIIDLKQSSGHVNFASAIEYYWVNKNWVK